MARGVLAKDVNKTELLHELMALDFEGATGRVDFDENGDRIGYETVIKCFLFFFYIY